jgi:hypothetical protein
MKADVAGGTKRNSKTHSQLSATNANSMITPARKMRRHNGRRRTLKIVFWREVNIIASMRKAVRGGNPDRFDPPIRSKPVQHG